MTDPEGDKITDLTAEHRLFIPEEIDLTPGFFFGLWRSIQVPTGQLWQIYRDGVFHDQLKAGPHILWNSLWHKWKAYRVNLRIVFLHFTLEGRIKGPSMPKDAQGIDLDSSINVKLELACRIADVEKFLEYENPMTVFKASLQSIVVELIGQLPYNQFGEWATTLRNQIRERLQGGKNDFEHLIGMRVEEVYVTDVQPNTLRDRSMLAMYQQVEQVRRELAKVESDIERDNVKAQSFAEQAVTLHIAPSILALQDSPIGKELIARDADLRKMMVAAGLNPGVSVQPLRDPQAQLGGGPPPSTGYLNPPASSGQFSSFPPSASSETQLSLFAIARTILEKDDTAFVHKVYIVQAGVSRSKPENFEGEPFDLTLNDTSKPISFDILVHTSKNIELLQGWQKRLHYKPNDLEAQSVEFPFKVVTPERTSLDINFYYERHWLRTVHFEFDVIEQAQSISVFSEE